MEKELKLIRDKFRRGYTFSSDSSSDSDNDLQGGEGVATRASARLVQAAPPVQNPARSPSPVEPERDSPEPAEVRPPDTSNLLFSDKHAVFENSEIKLYVVRDYLKRQKIFNLEDHLYQLKAEIKRGKAPLISSILDVLGQALEFVIATFKQHYKPGIIIHFNFTTFFFYFVVQKIYLNEKKRI